MCYNSGFGFSEDESSCDEGEEVLVYRGPRVKAPEEVAGQSSAVTSETMAGSRSGASVDRLFVSADVSINAKEDQEEFQGG